MHLVHHRLEDAAAACGALAAGHCDLVALGRQLIADARWPKLMQEGRASEILACRKCNEGCFGTIKVGKPVVCVQWKEDEVAAWL